MDSDTAAVPILPGVRVRTFPWATSSLWAADAAFTRALVAAAMDLAASSICSSKLRDSSASYNEQRLQREMQSEGGHILPEGAVERQTGEDGPWVWPEASAAPAFWLQPQWRPQLPGARSQQ